MTTARRTAVVALRFAPLALLAALVGCAADTPPTQVLVYVWAEPGVAADTLALDVQA